MAARKPTARKGGARKAPPAPDDDDEDDDGDAVCDLPHLEPGQVPISVALFEQMLNGRAQSEERELAFAKLNDVNFTGLRQWQATVHDEKKADREYLEHHRRIYDEKCQENVKLNMQVAEMVRSSEDAKLERERIEAARQEKEIELAALKAKFANERQMASDELKSILAAGQELIAGIAPLAVPFFASWMKSKGIDIPMPQPGMAGPGMGLPQAPPQQAASQPYKYQLSNKDIGAWMQVFQAGFGQLSEESASVLRGLISHAIFKVDGAPQINANKLIEYITKDVGLDALNEFVALTQRAWKPIEQHANGANGSATATPN
jgi:hypothetical protein